MTLRDRLAGVWSSPPPGIVDRSVAGGVPLIPNETYLRLRLERMQLRQGRTGWKTRRPLLHSLSVAAGVGGRVEVPHVADAGAVMSWADGGGDRVVISNLALYGPSPYLGGETEITCGLFSITDGDFAKDLLGLVADLSAIVGVEAVASAVRVAEPIKRGVESLVGADDTNLVLGIRTSLAEGTGAFTGHLVAHGDSIDRRADLTVANDGRLLDARGDEVQEDYIVLRVEALDRREDGLVIPEIAAAWREGSIAAASGDRDRLVRAKTLLRAAVVDSPQLIASDQVRLIAAFSTHIATLSVDPDGDAERLVAGADGDGFAQALRSAPEPDEARRIGLSAVLRRL